MPGNHCGTLSKLDSSECGAHAQPGSRATGRRRRAASRGHLFRSTLESSSAHGSCYSCAHALLIPSSCCVVGQSRGPRGPHPQQTLARFEAQSGNVVEFASLAAAWSHAHELHGCGASGHVQLEREASTSYRIASWPFEVGGSFPMEPPDAAVDLSL